jgi:hypothetical protein
MDNKKIIARPSHFEERFRLYIDESGDHVYRMTDEISHRFLCLLGCWFRNPFYLDFHKKIETLKLKYFNHHPDEPVILHREDIINRRKAFKVLQDEDVRRQFDDDLSTLLLEAQFTVVAVVIDKKALQAQFGEQAAHPYHLAMGFMLQRYAGYLNHINRIGDVMAESRGGYEDRLLAESYTRIYERGTWMTDRAYFQNSLSSSQIKLKQKSANISGLQLADLLGHPVKQYVLAQYGFIEEKQLGAFARHLMPVFANKFNFHLYEGRIEGYGYLLYPKK